MPTLVHPALRAFVAVAEHGALPAAAEVVNRTPSALSLQIAALEARLGQPLFVRHPRGMQLTPAGQRLLGHARTLLAVEAEAEAALSRKAPPRVLRLGMPQDFADSLLADALARCRQTHPALAFRAVIERNSRVAALMAAGELDLALLISARRQRAALASSRRETRWFARRSLAWRRGTPLPLVLLEEPCLFRRHALAALERAGVRWEAAFVTASVSAMWAAVQGGIGVTARMALGAPAALDDVGERLGLPRLPSASLSLVRNAGTASKASDRLAAVIETALDDTRG